MTVAYGARALSLISDDDGVHGVRVKHDGKTQEVRARCVVLAAGGFQANAEMAHALPGAGLGTREGARHALQHRRRHPDGAGHRRDADRQLVGRPRGAAGTATRRSSATSRSATISRSTRIRGASASTRNGERFVDEGADFRNYTYAKYGRVILKQPQQFAWQVFDAKVVPMLRDEYRIRRVTKVRADTLEELCAKLDDTNGAKALETIKAYNKAVMTDVQVRSRT